MIRPLPAFCDTTTHHVSGGEVRRDLHGLNLPPSAALMPKTQDQSDGARRFSDVIEDLTHGLAPRLTLAELVAAFGERGFGAMILVLSLLALLPWPPGGKAVFAAPIILMSLELALQRDTVWLPAWALRASVSRAAFANLISTPWSAPAWLRRWVLTFELRLGLGRKPVRYVFAPHVRRAVRRRPRGLSVIRMLRGMERLTRPRLSILTGEIADTFTGLVCVVLALMMALPIPFGDMLPGLALVLFALGMMQRDGVAILLGVVGTGLCGLYIVLIWATVVEIGEHIAAWATRLFG